MIRSSRKLWAVVRWDGNLVDTFTDKAAAEDAATWWTGSWVVRSRQHHQPNPILLAVRKYAALENFGTVSETVIGNVLAELGGLNYLTQYEGREIISPAIVRASLGELRHARRVLTRLYTLIGASYAE